MLDLIAEGAAWLFPGVQTAKLIKSGVNVTSSTRLLVFIKNITLVIVDCCTPPPVKLAAHCVAAGSLIVASVINPNSITIGSAIHVVTEIYDNY